MCATSTAPVARRPSSRRPGTARALRVLICATDGGAILRALSPPGDEDVIEARAVGNPRSLASVLGEAWDAVVVDDCCPGWSARRVVKEVRGRGDPTPVVAICDPARETHGAGLVAQGAADFLASDRLARLPIALRAAVEREAVRRELARTEAALASADGMLWAAFGTSSTAVVVVDQQGQVAEWNQAAERLLGWPAGEARGRCLVELVGAEGQRERLTATLAAAAASPSALRLTEPRVVRRRDGELLRVEVWAMHRTGENRGVVLALGDVTPRWRNDRLRDRRIGFLRALDDATGDEGIPEVLHQLAMTIEAEAAWLWECEPRGALHLRAVWGVASTAETDGMIVSALPTALVRQACATERIALAGGRAEEACDDDAGFRIAIPLSHGDRLWGAVELSGPDAPSLDDDLVIHLMAVGGQLGGYLQRRRSEADLARSLDELRRNDGERRRLMRLLVQAHEDERRAIAADIHDDPLQVMAAVGLRLHTLRRRLGEGPAEQTVQAVEEMVGSAVSRLRNLMFNLRPPGLDHGDLMGPLRERLEQLRQDDSIDFTLDGSEPEAMTTEGRVVLYRIAQEAVTNVAKHASASKVSVEVAEQSGGCLMRIVDDGAGLGEAADRPGHVGLPAMRERAGLVGGWVHMEATAAGGTAVVAWVPLPSEARLGQEPRS